TMLPGLPQLVHANVQTTSPPQPVATRQSNHQGLDAVRGGAGKHLGPSFRGTPDDNSGLRLAKEREINASSRRAVQLSERAIMANETRVPLNANLSQCNRQAAFAAVVCHQQRATSD